jgi:hypothetical protein
MTYITIFFLILSVIFFIFGVISKKEHDEGNASVHIAVGVVLSIVTIILFVASLRFNINI